LSPLAEAALGFQPKQAGEMSSELRHQTREFLNRKQTTADEARQMVALRIMCGLDMEDIMRAGAEERVSALRSVERLVERERLKGLCRHWSYDLNRHIALGQACDALRRSLAQSAGAPKAGKARDDKAQMKNGARRRRCW